MFCIESNCATVCLQGTHAIRFFQLLDPHHQPSHRIAFMRLTRLLEQAVLREYHRLVTDNALLYGSDFASTNSDFYTNKERCETYGCLVANMLSQQYVFKVSCLLISCAFEYCQLTLFCIFSLFVNVYSLLCYRMDDVYSSATGHITMAPRI
jgi:hypothetical protein